jgi:hypothetical protein
MGNIENFKINIEDVDKVELGKDRVLTFEENKAEIEELVKIYNNSSVCNEEIGTTGVGGFKVYYKDGTFLTISVTTQGFHYALKDDEQMLFYEEGMKVFASKYFDLSNK